MADVWRFFSHEDDLPDLDADALCGRLGAELSIPTVDGPTHDQTDWAAFDRLEAFFRASFPLLFDAARVEKFDHSLMLTVPGRNQELRPALLLGHMDVVPVVPGTEADWAHGAFDGHVDDEYVWGRGALDMSDQVMGNLEAVEYVLGHDGLPERTIIVCMGQDEETLQTGARTMGAELARRGIRCEFSLDEGSYVVSDLAPYGAPGRHGLMVFLAEKGYADVRLTVRSTRPTRLGARLWPRSAAPLRAWPRPTGAVRSRRSCVRRLRPWGRGTAPIWTRASFSPTVTSSRT